MFGKISAYKIREANEARQYIVAQAAVEAQLAVLKNAADEAYKAVRAMSDVTPLGDDFTGHKVYFETKEAVDECREVVSAVHSIMLRIAPTYRAEIFARLDRMPDIGLSDDDGLHDPFAQYADDEEFADVATSKN